MYVARYVQEISINGRKGGKNKQTTREQAWSLTEAQTGCLQGKKKRERMGIEREGR